MARDTIARWVGVAAFVGLLVTPAPAGLSTEAWRVVALTAWMATWWLGEAAPLAVTALLPLVVLPVLGVAPMGDVAVGYADPLLFLILGGFFLGHAVEVVGLHERFVALVLRVPGLAAGPRQVALALMIATAAMSSLVSNTATMMTMLPIVLATARVLGGEGTRASLALAVAYAASIGGLCTLVGTPTNAVLAGLAPRLVGEDVGFGRWMMVGVPAAVVLLPVAWWIVCVRALPLPAHLDDPPVLPGPGPWRPGERIVLAVGAAALLLWTTAEGVSVGGWAIPGWGAWVPGRTTERDAGVAVLAALVLFLVPVRRGGETTRLLSWPQAEAAVPWSVILLFGGGFALGDAVASTGIGAWVAASAGGLRDVPGPVGLLVVCAVVVGLSEIASNMATAQLALPVVAEVARAVGADPMVWMVAATLASSCGFMLPVATAANAIAAEAGGVPPRDMLRAGLALNVAGVFVATAVATWIAPWVFG